jgi:hypothetical protein
MEDGERLREYWRKAPRGREGEGEILEERSMRSEKKMNKYDYR